jgi:spermidine/putrescine transport system substrate-binding protein
MRVLMSTDAARHLGTELSRRRLFGIAGSAALAAFLASCGDDDDSASSATTAPSSGASGATATTRHASTGNSGANSFKPLHLGRVRRPRGDEHVRQHRDHDLQLMEEAIQKLVTAGGNGGYDMMCPTGVYIPQLVGEDLLEPLDLSRVTNFKNLDPAYTNQAWDPATSTRSARTGARPVGSTTRRS